MNNLILEETRKRAEGLVRRLKRMGLSFLALSAGSAGWAIFTSLDRSTFVAMAALFFTMGLFCLGSIWGKKLK